MLLLGGWGVDVGSLWETLGWKLGGFWDGFGVDPGCIWVVLVWILSRSGWVLGGLGVDPGWILGWIWGGIGGIRSIFI